MNLGSDSPIVSAKAMTLMVALCIVASWVFVPDREELVSRLDKDGHVDRLKALAQDALKDETPNQPISQSDAERMRAWIKTPDTQTREDPAVVAGKKIMCAITETPAAVGSELVVEADRLVDPDLFGELMDALARRALGLQHQAEAGVLLGQWNQRQPSWELTMRTVQAWRWAGKSDEALKAITAAIGKGLKPGDAPENIEGLRLKLALESNQPNLAFDMVEKQYQTAPSSRRPAILHRLLEYANAGDRTPEASRIVADHLATIPFQTRPLSDAIAMVASGHPFASSQEEADYQEYAPSLAHWQEWANHGDIAIETWFRLALIGNEEAWGRVLDLYDDVMRTNDFIKVLAYRISKGLNLDKQILLANLLVEEGRIEDAIRQYETAAKEPTQSTAAHRALARIYQQQCEWEKSFEAFGKVLATTPADLEAGKGQAFSLVRQHHYEEACNRYVALSAAHPEDAELQEVCAGLCDSLGRNTEAREASQRLLACPGHESTPEEHLELADSFRLAGNTESAVTALRAGFQQFPASIRTRLTLAESLSKLGEHNEAVRLLAFEPLRENPGAMDLLVSEAVEATNAEVAVSFIGNEPPPCLQDLPFSSLRLSFLLDRLSRRPESEKIIADLLHDSRYRQTETWLELGNMCLSIGDDAHAEAFVELYISSNGTSISKAWELLGDIYQDEERNEEALTAYRKAVEVIGTKSPTGIVPDHPSVKVSQNDASVR